MDESSAADFGASLEPFSSAFAEVELGTNIDFGRSVVDLLEALSIWGVPGVGADTKSLYEVSEVRGSFQGNRRRVIHANMMAIDQISVGCGS